MTIRTTRQVWFFAITVTAIALAAAETLNVALYPPEILSQTVVGTAFIVVVVTMPICLWVGAKLRDHATLSAQLRMMVNRDRLTGLGTRDFFFSQLAQAPGITGVMLMIDADHFKAVNDTHGHLIGDEVIKAIAAVLQLETRDSDLLCRFGGEEFVAFLPNTAMSDGYEMAERLRCCIAEVQITPGDTPIGVTVSIGGALKHRAADIQTVLRQADDALYRAKGEGRNCTIFASTPKIV